MKKKDRENIQFLLITGGALFIAYKAFGAFKGIFESLGLSNSAADISVMTTQQDPGSPWSPLYYKTLQRQGKNIMLLTQASADLLAKQIYESTGAFTDNWPPAFGAIKQAKYKTQISFLAERFKAKYNADLITWLPGGMWPQDRFSNDEVNQAIEYVKKLPTGIV
jgi:hypothetical protein